VIRWLAFVQAPSRSSWYAAHNSSVALGYIDNAALARDEIPLEQLLMNNTITRVLFAEALEDGRRLDLGPVAHIARWLGDPRTDGVGTFVDVPDFYPDHYPLSHEDDLRITHRVRSLGDMLAAVVDDLIVAPVVPRLFADAAERLALVDLKRFVHAEAVAYPWALLVDAEELAHIPIVDKRPSIILRALAHVLTPGGTTV